MSRARTLLATLAAAVLAGSSLFAADADLRDKAVKLNDITGSDAQTLKLRELIKDKANTKKLLAEAMAFQKEKADDKPLAYNACLILARAAHEIKEGDAGAFFYRQCADEGLKLQSSEKIINALDGLIDLYWDTKKYKEAAEACKEFLELRSPRINEAKPLVMERLIQATAKQGQHDEALKMADQLIEADDNGWYFTNLKAWVQRDAGQNEAAAETYLLVIDRIGKNKRMKKEDKERFTRGTRYILSSVYVDLKQIDKAAEQLQTLLKADPDNATFNNDLGFIWADHDMNLDESEKMIRKAIEQDRKIKKEAKEKNPDLPEELLRDNAAYLDSLGWVLFKKKEYAEAKKYLLEASKDKDDGQHIEIWDHLADVHYALGEKQEALKVWEESLKLEDVSPRDAKRREAVKEKIKKVKAELDK
jgi:tetratricopeptide (TPR) repeat protein